MIAHCTILANLRNQISDEYINFIMVIFLNVYEYQII